jgi:GNAT superfamily N-acetyltransferase
MGKRQFDVRPFEAAKDRSGVLKLWAAVCGFDGSVPPVSPDHLDALLEDAATDGGSGWRVATAPNGAVVGVLDVYFVGSKRTRFSMAVNPAWRRSGIGARLLEELPGDKRLLTASRLSVDGATALLEKAGFSERHREARLRMPRVELDEIELPEWASLEEDESRDEGRFADACHEAFGEGEDGPGVVSALLGRPGTRVTYLTTPQGDQGVCVVTALDRCKKSERTKDGEPRVGLLERVGLAKACRGKGLSRPFVRHGLRLLWDDGYEFFEVTADGRRPQAQKLYERDGFTEFDEDILWIRRDDE